MNEEHLREQISEQLDELTRNRLTTTESLRTQLHDLLQEFDTGGNRSDIEKRFSGISTEVRTLYTRVAGINKALAHTFTDGERVWKEGTGPGRVIGPVHSDMGTAHNEKRWKVHIRYDTGETGTAFPSKVIREKDLTPEQRILFEKQAAFGSFIAQFSPNSSDEHHARCEEFLKNILGNPAFLDYIDRHIAQLAARIPAPKENADGEQEKKDTDPQNLPAELQVTAAALIEKVQQRLALQRGGRGAEFFEVLRRTWMKPPVELNADCNALLETRALKLLQATVTEVTSTLLNEIWQRTKPDSN